MPRRYVSTGLSIATGIAPVDCIAVVDEHDAIRTAVELWCRHAEPPIRYAGGFSSPERFLSAYGGAMPTLSAVIVDPQRASRRIDFAGVDRIVGAGHRVIVYTAMATEQMIYAGLQHGALTCLTKSEDKQHLINAIRAARTGTPYHGPKTHDSMLKDGAVDRPTLGPREKEVLMAWLRAETKDEVAGALSISPATVRTHLARIRAKYAAVGRPAHSKAALVARAIQDGILLLDEL
ncbi:LuxR C-terminal-related transcriptional regulator [Mycolicibacterium moriokaense]|uniref:DNA-binding NarL/FixJ family response regulator n=1 Tax=Mycolicibacterium moriokaense TaxID=39691 RepID=A0A318HC81_9MYCO|nr:LuxR C-terminal-related transcriptional regulator [Mycolicibacterium moriokaense]PXW96891.1 DNA-binding NarL/FixJ family response regulator [Mycolicibacterium moriokaense]